MMAVVRGRDLSLDTPLRPGDSPLSFLDRLEDPAMGPEAQTLAGQDLEVRSRLFRDALSKLGAREQSIIQLRHCGEQSRTLREVGEMLGLSRERVRQLEQRAMIKLRRLVQGQYRVATAA